MGLMGISVVACNDSSTTLPPALVKPEFDEEQQELVQELVDEHHGLQIRSIARPGRAAPDEPQDIAPVPGVIVDISPAVSFSDELKESLYELNRTRPLSVMAIRTDRLKPRDLAAIAELADLHKLTVNCVQVDDDALRHLLGLRELQELKLVNCPVTDAGLKTLAQLPALQTLWLSNTKVTGTGFADFNIDGPLRVLFLQQSPVDDDGLRSIARLTSLELLVLSGSNVTDAGLDSLIPLKKLHALNVERTAVTGRGVESLRKHMPKLDIAH